MKNYRSVRSTLLIPCLIIYGLFLWSRPVSAADRPGGGFAASVTLTNANVLPSNAGLVQVFIPTRSQSAKCLITLNDTTLVALGTQAFCAVRQSSILGSGIVITIDYFQVVPANYATYLTLWQEGARFYGTPVLCETSAAGGAC